MKKILAILAFFCGVGTAAATENIIIVSPYGAGHGGTAAEYRIIDRANALQQRYRFTLEFKPGAQQTLSLRETDREPQRRLAIVAASIVENTRSGAVNVRDYVPVSALGEACWAVVSNLGNSIRGLDSIRESGPLNKEITVGGVAFGNAAHLTALEIAQRYNLAVRYVVFRSNTEAMIQGMVGSDSINLVIVPLKDFENFRNKQPRLNVLAASCPTRLPQLPQIKTLQEQGITAPYIFNAIVAHRSMETARRDDIAQILNQALREVGEKAIQDSSDMKPPTLRGLDLSAWFDSTYRTVDRLLDKHAKSIDLNRQGLAARP